jgi:hypothetical protein
MHRKTILIASLLLGIVIGSLSSVFAVDGHPVVTAEGWAIVKTEDGWIRGDATLELFLPSSHEGPPWGIEAHLTGEGYEYWWVIMDLWQRRNLAILLTEPVNPDMYPEIARDPITIMTFHRTTPTRVLAFGGQLFFIGQIISCQPLIHQAQQIECMCVNQPI